MGIGLFLELIADTEIKAAGFPVAATRACPGGINNQPFINIKLQTQRVRQRSVAGFFVSGNLLWRNAGFIRFV